MKKIAILYFKELNQIFKNPVSYIFGVVFLAFNNFFFFPSLFFVNQATLRPLFGNIALSSIIFIPLIASASFGAEKKSGTLELLYSLPVKKSHIFWSKFLALMTFFIFVFSFTLIVFFSILALGNPDIGAAAASYLGIFFLTAVYVSITLFVSLYLNDQIASFLVSAFVILLFHLAGQPFLINLTPFFLQPLLWFISPFSHLENFTKGLIYFKDIIYFLSLITLFSYLSINKLNLDYND